MLFGKKNDKIANEKTIYETRPNMLFGCKKAIFGVILLIIVLSIASPIISYIGNMQVYLISYINIGLTRYSAIALFLIILILIAYIIWQLLSWYSVSYTLTDRRIIVKKGLLNTKKSYMPYNTIQDINVSQNIIEKIVGIGTVAIYSAYDNNQMEIADISNPGEVEDILFEQMNTFRFNPRPYPDYDNQYESRPRRFFKNKSNKNNSKFSRKGNPPRNLFEEEGYGVDEEYRPYLNDDTPDYVNGPGYHGNSREDYYDEPHERIDYYEGDDYYSRDYDRQYKNSQYEYSIANDYPSRESRSYHSPNDYEYYPEDLNYENNSRKYKKYDYEYYDDGDLERNIDSAMNNLDDSYKFEGYRKSSYEDGQDYYSYEDYGYDDSEDYYNERYNQSKQMDSQDYHDDYRQSRYGESEPYYNDYDEMDHYLEKEKKKESKKKDYNSQKIVQRHFDKFRK